MLTQSQADDLNVTIDHLVRETFHMGAASPFFGTAPEAFAASSVEAVLSDARVRETIAEITDDPVEEHQSP